MSPKHDTTLSYMSIQGKPDKFSDKPSHLHLFLNSVHKYTDIYDNISLVALTRGSGV